MRTTCLVLWDIDHTLIKTGGVGSEVFKIAFEAATGRELAAVPDPTGKLEPAIFAAACAENGVTTSPELFGAFAAAQEKAYRDHAADLVELGGVLPGVEETLAALAATPGLIQTVLSGNTRRSGRAKLEVFGLAPWIDFSCAGGGDDADTRAALVPVVWERVRAVHGIACTPQETVVVGDTPADVETALTNGCQVVAVATGKTEAAQLVRAGARVVLSDLSNRERALTVILSADGR